MANPTHELMQFGVCQGCHKKQPPTLEGRRLSLSPKASSPGKLDANSESIFEINHADNSGKSKCVAAKRPDTGMSGKEPIKIAQVFPDRFCPALIFQNQRNPGISIVS